jgi:hypothetical protein
MERLGTLAASLATRSDLAASARPVRAVIPTTRERDLPPLFVPEIDRELPRLVMFWEGGSASGESKGMAVLRRPFTDVERTALEERVWSLTCAVAPPQEADRDTLLEAISGMLGAFPAMQRHDDLTAMAIAAGYLWTARERPPWAILKACGLVRSGAAGLNRAFCPSEPEFNAIAERCTAAWVDALRRTKELLAGIDRQTRAKQLLAGKAASAPRPPTPRPNDRKLPSGDGKHAARALADLEARKTWLDDPPLG